MLKDKVKTTTSQVCKKGENCIKSAQMVAKGAVKGAIEGAQNPNIISNNATNLAPQFKGYKLVTVNSINDIKLDDIQNYIFLHKYIKLFKYKINRYASNEILLTRESPFIFSQSGDNINQDIINNNEYYIDNENKQNFYIYKKNTIGGKSRKRSKRSKRNKYRKTCKS